MTRYLIFGGTGSLGKKLIDRFTNDCDTLAVYSRDEAKHWTIANEHHTPPKFYVGDIRDKSRIRDVIMQYRPTCIIIAAALKQVDTCELSPSESIQTNLLGTQNIISVVNELPDSYVESSLDVLFVSTDKACSPVNVYGMCKAISERIVTSQAVSNSHQHKSYAPRYLATRYGNVLESRGSIIPLFRYQAESALEFTVTDPNMTRFVMTLDDSVTLIESALELGRSGQTWIPKLPAMRIGDLAEIFSEYYDKPIKIVGRRPGEKEHEDLINEAESVRTFKHQNFYVIDHAYSQGSNQSFKYSSSDSVLSKDELKTHLINLGIFKMPLSNFIGSSIEHIVKK